MIKKIILTFVVLLISVFHAFAENENTGTYLSPISIHEPNYFLFGGPEDQVKFKISVQYNMIYNSKLWYVAYSQESWWKLYEYSSPFYENNYNPETFLLFKNNDNCFDANMGFIDFVRIGLYEHKSNGRDGKDSRGQDKYYIESQVSYGDVYNFGARLKLFGYYHIAEENKDLAHYQGYYETEFFMQLRSKSVKYLDKEKVYVKFGSSLSKGWIEYGARIRLVTSRIQPYLYIQGYYGYNENMIDYNKKENAIRIGLGFE